MAKFVNEQDKERFEVAVAANMEKIIAAGAQQKYDCYGVYCIKVDDKIVYVGKSRNMLKRVAQHMAEIEETTEKNMYIVLRDLRAAHSLAFDTLYTTTEEDDDAIGFAEARLIKEYQPCLNIQFPHLDDYRKYDYRRLAKHITAKEVEQILDNFT